MDKEGRLNGGDGVEDSRSLGSKGKIISGFDRVGDGGIGGGGGREECPASSADSMLIPCCLAVEARISNEKTKE